MLTNYSLHNPRVWLVSTMGMLAMAIFCIAPHWVGAIDDTQKTPEQINQELSDLNGRFNTLQEQAKQYTIQLQEQQTKAHTLNGRIAILKNQMLVTQNTIDTLSIEIQRLALESQKTKLLIEDKNLALQDAKQSLADMVQNFYELQLRRGVEALLTHDSISDYFVEQSATQQIQRGIQRNVDQLSTLKDQLIQEHTQLTATKTLTEQKQTEMALQRERLQDQKRSADVVLRETKNSEARYQSLLKELQQEQADVDTNIKRLEQVLRQKLHTDELARLGIATFTWPVPNRGITTTFHDPDYPFRYLFEHPGIDIRAGQGSTIVAPANGIIGKVRDAGYGYSYLLVLHADGFSTVYGHISGFLVREGDFVVRGQPIALSGAMPGSRGAGPLTTGPHLHFEIRRNGTPIDPLIYLP